MEREWEALRAAGMPDGAVRPQRSVSLSAAREAVRTLRGRQLTAAEREALLSWLRAFQDEFPRRFASELGHDGERLVEALERQPFDRNRYLKLRRIAAENLSHFL